MVVALIATLQMVIISITLFVLPAAVVLLNSFDIPIAQLVLVNLVVEIV